MSRFQTINYNIQLLILYYQLKDSPQILLVENHCESLYWTGQADQSQSLHSRGLKLDSLVLWEMAKRGENHSRESDLQCTQTMKSKTEKQDQSTSQKGQAQGQKQCTEIIVNCQLFWTALNGTEMSSNCAYCQSVLNWFKITEFG